MDIVKRERKRRLRMEREYEAHVRRKEKIRAFLTYLRAIIPRVEECEEAGRLP